MSETSDQLRRRLMVRFGAIGGLMLVAWLVALVTGMPGFPALPAFHVGLSGRPAVPLAAGPATTAKPPASPSDSSPSDARVERTTRSPSQAAPAQRRSASAGTAGTVRGANRPVGFVISSAAITAARMARGHGRPALTPSGRVPGARANDGNRRAHGLGRGGGRANAIG
jgi:hypothetical protein